MAAGLIAVGVLLVAGPAGIPADIDRGQKGEGEHRTGFAPPIDYRITRSMYRESFERDDAWRAEEERIRREKASLRLSGTPRGRALLTAFPHNRPGGNVVYRFKLKVVDPADNWSLKLTTNAFDHSVNILGRRPRVDERLQLFVEDSLRVAADGNAVVTLQSKAMPIEWMPEPGREFEVEFINVDRYKELRIDGNAMASCWVHSPWVASEGALSVEVESATAVLTAFEVLDTEWDVPAQEFATGELLFRDDFTDVERTKGLWAYELKKEGDDFLDPIVRDGWLRVERFSAVWCREAFDGPVIYSFECRPVPKDSNDATSITDAIFFFHTTWNNMPFDFFCRKHYDVRHSVYGDLSGYWMDWGGNGNKTTRLRKLPYRQLMRQSIDPADQLKPNHIHKVQMICAGRHVRFVVDGRPIIAYHDLAPCTEGHFGMLGYVRATEIRRFRVHRAEAAR